MHGVKMRKKRTGNLANWTADELREAGIPYLVSPDNLATLGYDPDEFFSTHGTCTGYMLDRTKHREIVSRVQALQVAQTMTTHHRPQ
jgi:hypothetical protein